jgi:hypothetical protein
MARTKTVTVWENKADVDEAIHNLYAEMDRQGVLNQETEREVQHSLRMADSDLTVYFYQELRKTVPNALHYFEEAGGGS